MVTLNAFDAQQRYAYEIGQLRAQIAAATAAGNATQAAALTAELNARVSGIFADPAAAYSPTLDTIMARRWSNGDPYELTVAALRSGLLGHVNVQDYGAAGDGATDDTAAIQAAIDAGTGRVIFPAGRYRTTAALTIAEATVLEGVASAPGTTPGTTIQGAYILHDHAGDCLDFVGGTTGDKDNAGSGIRNLCLVQNHGDGTAAVGAAIKSVAVDDIQRCNWLWFENVQINAAAGKDQWGHCFYLDGTAAPDRLRDVFIRGGRWACAAPGTQAGYFAGIANLFIADVEANLDAANVTFTGTALRPTAGGYIANCTFKNLLLDHAQFCYVIGGQFSAYEATANASSCIATGTACGVTGPTLAGNRNAYFGRDAANQYVHVTTNDTIEIDAGTASVLVRSALRVYDVVRMSNAQRLVGRNAADNNDVAMIAVEATDRVRLCPAGADLQFGGPKEAPGGGAAATLATIGGAGPTAAAQNEWLVVYNNAGQKRFIPLWS